MEKNSGLVLLEAGYEFLLPIALLCEDKNTDLNRLMEVEPDEIREGQI